MINEAEAREIRLYFKLIPNVSKAAIFFHHSRVTIRKVLKTLPQQRAHRELKHIVNRRKQLVVMAKETAKINGVLQPKYGSASNIARAYSRVTGEFASKRTVSDDLKKCGLRPYKRPRRPTRRVGELADRRAFCNKYLKKSDAWFKSVTFSDETWLTCNEYGCRVQYGSSKKDIIPMERKSKWNVPAMQCWGCVGYNYKSKLVLFPATVGKGEEKRAFRLNSAAYIRRCLSHVADDLVKGKKVFIQDGARSHAGAVKYLSRKNVDVLLDFPPYSPDMNMIEMLWNDLKRRVGKRCPLTFDELQKAAVEAWDEIPQELINNHVSRWKKVLQTEVKKKCV